MNQPLRSSLPVPLAIPVVAWCVGIIAARSIMLPAVTVFGLCSACLLLACGFKKLRIYLILLTVLGLGYLRYEIAIPSASNLEQVIRQKHIVIQPCEFVVNKVMSTKWNYYYIRLISVNHAKVKDKALLKCAEATARLIPNGVYKGILYLEQYNTDSVIDVHQSTTYIQARPLGSISFLRIKPPPITMETIRLKLLDHLNRKLGTQADFAKVLLFSDLSAKREWMNIMSMSGLSHLIAVSGMHILMIYFIMMVFLRSFLPLKYAEASFIVLIICYAALNNWVPSVSRAILVIILLIISRWLNRPLSNAQTLAIALWTITIFNPQELFSVGLQMSFVCVIVLFYGIPKWGLNPQVKLIGSHSLVNLLNHTLYLVKVSTLISIAISPLTLLYFQQASINGIIGNILGVPIVMLILPLSIALFIIPSGNMVFANLLISYQFLVWLFQKWVQWVAGLPFYIQNMMMPDNWIWVLSVLIILFFLLINKRYVLLKRAIIPSSILIFGLVAIPHFQAHKGFRIYCFNSGVSDCSLITLNNGTNILVDTGGLLGNDMAEKYIVNNSDTNNCWSQKKLIPWLNRKRITNIDYLILTHMHADHCGGFPSVLHAYKIKHIIVTDETIANPQWQNWLNQQLLNSDQVIVLTDTLSLDIGQNKLIFLHPDKNWLSDKENNNSITFRLDYQDQSFLFTGDIEADAEEYLVQNYARLLDTDYLKAPHHGSKNSNTDKFIDAVSPREVWITASLRNRFQFPHQETLQRYQTHGIRIRRTGENTITYPEFIHP